MRWVFRAFFQTIKYILLFIGIYLLAALALPYIKIDGEPLAKQEVTIYLLSNGVHTDFVLPSRTSEKDWTTLFLPEHTRDGNAAAWLAVGWGDKGFYLETPTWSDLKFSTAFNAIFGLGQAALHTAYYDTMDGCRKCVSLQISVKQYRQLIDYIEQSLHRDKGAVKVIPTPSAYGERDAFYAAKGRYHLFYSCNTWVNNGLKAINAEAALWTITDFGLLQHYLE